MTDTDAPDGGSSRSELHTVLANETRRAVLRYLQVREDQVSTVDELADALVARDGDFDEPTRAKLILHHRDLPRMAACGAIEFDPRTGTVRYRGETRLEALLPASVD